MSPPSLRNLKTQDHWPTHQYKYVNQREDPKINIQNSIGLIGNQKHNSSFTSAVKRYGAAWGWKCTARRERFVFNTNIGEDASPFLLWNHMYNWDSILQQCKNSPKKCRQNSEQFIKDLKNMGCSRKKYYLVARCNSNYFTFGMKSNRCNGTVCEKKQPMNSSERETNIHMKRNKNIYSKCYKSNLEKKRRDSQ